MQSIDSLLGYRVQPMTMTILTAALVSRQRWKISYWDAAIVEAARACSCPELLTEALQDGMDFAGVRVRNPFKNPI